MDFFLPLFFGDVKSIVAELRLFWLHLFLWIEQSVRIRLIRLDEACLPIYFKLGLWRKLPLLVLSWLKLLQACQLGDCTCIDDSIKLLPWSLLQVHVVL